MGLECTAIFAVFTGQAWNMMLTLYQTLRIVPKELDEAARSFNYNPWQRFWRLEFIYSVPGLLWNAMVSQSAAWFAWWPPRPFRSAIARSNCPASAPISPKRWRSRTCRRSCMRSSRWPPTSCCSIS
ncbi:ABC transporter permease subunit [Serratia ureilytica]